ncbi:uncharacterized protein LOC114929632 [Nylanderia fulva]|uniref:uncharacterized protein LOC114929632 n=1 Tax=Nylanderia fulva TaxID=613905 RepID=UPI0010FB6490|nr:uncharacterized protein LOC114929632 [Nylanderia fulva]
MLLPRGQQNRMYCKWLFQFSTNFVEHECFKHYVEDKDRIVVDENFVVTICYNSMFTTVRDGNLRDNYTKARKKIKDYVLSGSAASGQKKPKFRFYDMMTILNNFLETRQTVSSLPNVDEKYGTFESYEDDTNSFPSMQTTIDASPILTPTCVPLRTPTPTLIPPRTSISRSVSPPTLFSTLRILATNVKKQKTDVLQTALIEALKELTTQTVDPLDGFLARLGEGMRRLPYRQRAHLEIRFLTLLGEAEDLCGINID